MGNRGDFSLLKGVKTPLTGLNLASTKYKPKFHWNPDSAPKQKSQLPIEISTKRSPHSSPTSPHPHHPPHPQKKTHTQNHETLLAKRSLMTRQFPFVSTVSKATKVGSWPSLLMRATKSHNGVKVFKDLSMAWICWGDGLLAAHRSRVTGWTKHS